MAKTRPVAHGHMDMDMDDVDMQTRDHSHHKTQLSALEQHIFFLLRLDYATYS